MGTVTLLWRGCPNGTAWLIGPLLTGKKNVAAALFRRPFLGATALDCAV
ncbi:MAG TPA: hypothetical protein PLD20_08945 [Blastocatellia bacterium]|nr:hypothetical protein [Blastocatellia bacterium]HMV82585.1 hypothetical protein [Blastocatellia bacterium]HMX29950.1 hypothetical protein [Blastocatellia bacterium]HMY72020.1 hypothetical protein [Blastocatellia bacterium]HMZ18043.1 hypothetical protein [Blastocatellia bacterium]